MSLSIDQLRAAFKKDEPTVQGPRTNNYYPFWNMKIGEQAIIRFLPDTNKDNPMGFMVEKLMHTLTINGENKSVPCLKMYGEECPICKVSAAFYKEGDKVNGKKYWRKKQNLAQALIMEDPLEPDQETGETHYGKVRFVALGYQLFNVIKEAFESGDLDEIPYAYEGGYNFIIKKTKQGDYDTYALGSKFARKATDLSDDEIVSVQEGSVSLETLLPKNPGYDRVSAMLEAALTGNEYTEGSSFSNDDDDGDMVTDENSRPTRPSATKNNVAASLTENSTHTSDSSFDDEADVVMDIIRARRNKQ